MVRQSRSTIITSRSAESAACGRGTAAPLESGVDDRAARSRDRFAGARHAIGRRRRELVGRRGIGGDGDAAVDRALAKLPAAQRPRAVEARGPHVRGPRRPLRRLQRERLGKMIDRLLDRMAVVRRTSVGRRVMRGGGGPARRNAWLSTSGYQPRCIAISRSHSVLVRRCEITRPSEWHLLQVDSASALAVYLKSIRRRSASHAAGFASSGASPRLFERYLTTCRAVVGLDVQPVERRHALNLTLPALGRVALKRNARHLPLVVGLMTRAARLLHGRVGDRNALFRLRGRRGGRLRRLRRSATAARRARERWRQRARFVMAYLSLSLLRLRCGPGVLVFCGSF